MQTLPTNREHILNTKSAILAAAIGLLSTLANAQRVGITPESLLTFDDVTMPGKDFRVLRTTYAPGGMNGKHYHPSHVVFYVLEVAGERGCTGVVPSQACADGAAQQCPKLPESPVPTIRWCPNTRLCL